MVGCECRKFLKTMMIKTRLYFTALVFIVLAATAHAQDPRVLTNQVGYESNKPKRAVVLTSHQLKLTSFDLVDETTGKSVYHGKPVYSGPVDKWKHWQFWTINFTPYTAAGTYRLRVNGPEGPASSWPFIIGSAAPAYSTRQIITCPYPHRPATPMPHPPHPQRPQAPTASTSTAAGTTPPATTAYTSLISLFHPISTPSRSRWSSTAS